MFYSLLASFFLFFFFFQAEDGIRDLTVTGVQTCSSDLPCGRGKERPRARTENPSANRLRSRCCPVCAGDRRRREPLSSAVSPRGQNRRPPRSPRDLFRLGKPTPDVASKSAAALPRAGRAGFLSA